MFSHVDKGNDLMLTRLTPVATLVPTSTYCFDEVSVCSLSQAIAVSRLCTSVSVSDRLMVTIGSCYPVWNPWQTHARFILLTFRITPHEIIQFTCHASAKTVTLHTFFHSGNLFSM